MDQENKQAKLSIFLTLLKKSSLFLCVILPIQRGTLRKFKQTLCWFFPFANAIYRGMAKGWQEVRLTSSRQHRTQKLGGGENDLKEESWLFILVVQVLKQSRQLFFHVRKLHSGH